ncbi:MAG: ABC transporter transmembrane domain-containing protein [Thalassospira sp.]|uniref:ABC transporter transmembrane domain-containing protein n=1 Tax=Thalassospira sp. TaxID=1912094 RepID=UPI003A8C66AA
MSASSNSARLKRAADTPAAGGFLRSFTRAAFSRMDVLLVSFGVNILSLALPLVVLQVYDRIVPEDAMDTFAILMVGIGVVAVLDYLLRAVRNHITVWSAARFEHAIGTRAVGRLIGAEIDEFEKSPASAHLDRLAAIEPLRDFHSGQGLIAVSDLPFVAIFLCLIWLIGGDLVLAPLSVAGAAAVFAILLGNRLDVAIRERADLDDQRYNFIFQVLNGIHSVKGLGMEAQFLRRYESILGPLVRSVEKVAFLSSLGQSMTTTLSNLAMVATGAFGSLLVVSGTITGGSLIACVLLAGRAVQPLMRMISLWVQSRNLKLAEESLDALMTLPQEHDRYRSKKVTPDRIGDIEINNVTVHRNTPDFPVLSKLNISIPEGSFIAVRGPAGGGKAAFLDLLAGYARPDQGTLTYNGIDAENVDFEALRHHIGYGKQEAVLYRGTIQENLTFSAIDRTSPRRFISPNGLASTKISP